MKSLISDQSCSCLKVYPKNQRRWCNTAVKMHCVFVHQPTNGTYSVRLQASRLFSLLVFVCVPETELIESLYLCTSCDQDSFVHNSSARMTSGALFSSHPKRAETFSGFDCRAKPTSKKRLCLFARRHVSLESERT